MADHSNSTQLSDLGFFDDYSFSSDTYPRPSSSLYGTPPTNMLMAPMDPTFTNLDLTSPVAQDSHVTFVPSPSLSFASSSPSSSCSSTGSAPSSTCSSPFDSKLPAPIVDNLVQPNTTTTVTAITNTWPVDMLLLPMHIKGLSQFDLSQLRQSQYELQNANLHDIFSFAATPASYLTAATHALTSHGSPMVPFIPPPYHVQMQQLHRSGRFQQPQGIASSSGPNKHGSPVSSSAQLAQQLSPPSTTTSSAPASISLAPMTSMPPQATQASPLASNMASLHRPIVGFKTIKLTKPRKPSKAAIKAAAGMGVCCHNCAATVTPLWRRSANNEPLCNACGLYLKLHAMHRPKHLQQIASGGVGGGNGGARGKSTKVFQLGPQDPSKETSFARLIRTSSPSTTTSSMSNPSCTNCKTTLTPLWRKDDAGEILCNACGLFYKLHHRHRPISLKRNVIRRRSRYENMTPSPSAPAPAPVPCVPVPCVPVAVYAQAKVSLQDQASLQAQAQLVHAQVHAQQVHVQVQAQALEWRHPFVSTYQTSIPS